jgi:hypothetical protein
MKGKIFSRLALAVYVLLFASSSGWARLPLPYEHQGVVATIDSEARKILLVEPAKPKCWLGWFGRTVKPTTFVWADETEFIKDGQPAEATALATGEHVQVHYWYPPQKGHPWLVKVSWGGNSGGP